MQKKEKKYKKFNMINSPEQYQTHIPGKSIEKYITKLSENDKIKHILLEVQNKEETRSFRHEELR